MGFDRGFEDGARLGADACFWADARLGAYARLGTGEIVGGPEAGHGAAEPEANEVLGVMVVLMHGSVEWAA